MNVEGLGNVRAVSRWLRDHGAVGISFQAIAGYLNQSGCPTISRAEAILNAFELFPSEAELKDLILRSKAASKEYREAFNPVSEKKTVVIHLNQIFPNLTPEEADARLEQRINKLYSGSGMLAQYVTDLIRKDFNEHIITEEAIK